MVAPTTGRFPASAGARIRFTLAPVLLACVVVACTSSRSADPAVTTTTVALPFNLHVSGAASIRDGQQVRIHIAAKPGSLVYGFEARLCAAAATYRLDSDMRPTLGGKCVVHPLSAESDDYQIVQVSPPYQVADGVFRAGVGTESFPLETGRQVTITCGHLDPCSLVLKIQFPNGFAIHVVPLSYG